MRNLKEQYSRAQILDRIYERLDSGDPIFAANASAGMVAKYAEKNDADLISVHSWGRFRYRGHPEPLPTLWWGGSNEMKDNVFEVHHEMENALDETPLIGGLSAYDCLSRHTDKLLEKAMDIGYDGIQNFPTWGYYKPMRWLRDAAGFGFERELDMIEMAHEKDIFTMAYSFWPEDTKKFVEKGADVIIAHAGWTTGGSTGAPEPGAIEFDWEKEGIRGQPRDLDDTVDLVNEIVEAAREVNSEQLVMATGGSINSPENAKEVLERTDADGFEVGQGLDAIPIENYLVKVADDYKDINLNPENPNVKV